jgi:hypothetical protein
LVRLSIGCSEDQCKGKPGTELIAEIPLMYDRVRLAAQYIDIWEALKRDAGRMRRMLVTFSAYNAVILIAFAENVAL